MFGKLLWLSFDALLISAFLAGIKRNTGLTPSMELIPNNDLRSLLSSYLEAGEYTFDFTVVFISRSRYFQRIR